MNFTELFIRRPVLSMVVSLLILLMGLQGILGLSVRQYPEIDETVVTVSTVYPGASADLIQGFITTPIARAVSNAEGVDYVTSTSRLGISQVEVHMQLDTDPQAALTEVLTRVQQVRGELPVDAEDPVIQKGTGQSFALMYMAFASTRMTPQEVTEYLSRVIQPRLATVPGVGDAQILGGQTFAMRIWLDPALMASRNLTAAEIVTAIQASNFLASPGKARNELVAYPVQTETTLNTPDAFGALPLASGAEGVVRLRDVARIELGSETYESKVSFSGRQGTFIAIYPAPAANPLDAAQAVRDAIPDIQSALPEGLEGQIVYDASRFISSSVEEVFITIAEAVVIVVLVILLFLGSFRSVIIPIVTIPLSLVGVCFFLYLLGYSLNTLTLLAMVLAIGLVVDDAIVVVENIHRHIEEGNPPVRAAIIGMREIFGPVVAMTITLAAVYLPIGFTQGLTGALFREFALTLAGAVILSGVIAVTLSPMMSSRLLKPGGGGRFAHTVDRAFERLSNAYERRLRATLTARGVTLFLVAALLGTTVWLYTKTPTELAPEEDQGILFSLVNPPQYATTDYTALFTDQITPLTIDVPGVEEVFAVVGMGGANTAFVGWNLLPWGERDQGSAEIQQEIQARLRSIAGVDAFVFTPPALPGTGGGLPVQMALRSIADPERVFQVAEQVRQAALESGRFIVVQNSLQFQTPQARVLIDRDRAASLGVSIRDIGTTLNVLVGEGPVARFDRDNRAYDIIPQVELENRLNPENLGSYYVRTMGGGMVPLSALVRVETRAAPAAIEQFNQLNSATLSALPRPGVSTGEALAALEQAARQYMPGGFFIDYGGESRLAVQEGNAVAMAFAFAVVVIYLVLAAQFESFRDPFIILMTVPLSIFGALVPLNLGLATVNIYTQVGLITLVGLITKHGILMVQFANQLREQKGIDRHEAIVEAARVRLRPILMTTAAMVLGVLPLLIATGAGAAARFSIGLVIAAGMSVGTLFTLFVVPAFYTLIAHRDRVKAPEPVQA